MTIANAPSVSVIIPVYNGMSTLPGCLDSLEEQDYLREFEVIVVDDGSSDGSGDYAESRGEKVIRQSNKGPGIARNTGAEAAQGEYLVFTDDDCIWDQNFLTELIKPVLGGGFIGSQGIQYSHQRSLTARFIQYEYSERYRLQAKAEYLDWVATYGACYLKSAFLEAGGFNDTYSSEDCELSIRLGKMGYRMTFAPNARLQHRHFENFGKFLLYKYKRAYWTIWLYKKYPNRIVNDKMTPSSRKTMMIFLSLAVVFGMTAIFLNYGVYLSLFFLIVFLGQTIPLTLRILKIDKVVGLLAPFFLTARTVSYIFGFTKGLIDYKRGIRTAKKSSAK